MWVNNPAHAIFQWDAARSDFRATREWDHPLSTTEPTVIRFQIRPGAVSTTVLREYTLTISQVGIVLSESALTVTEGTDPTGAYTVKLRSRPTGNVKVRAGRGAAYYVLSKDGGTTTAVSQDLTFTTQDWSTAQTVTVVALDDPNTLAGTSNVSHTTVDGDTSAEYDPVSNSNLAVTVKDDEAAIVVSRGTGALALTEEGSATYTVALGGPPTGNVAVQVTSDDTGAVTVAPSPLTFTTTTWNTGQTVTVTAADDADNADETATVTHSVVDASSSAEFHPAEDVTFTVNVRDNDFGLNVGAVSGQTTEAGGTATFPVWLNALPTAAVTVSVSSRDPGEGTVSPQSLVFTTQNWSTMQTVTATGVQDTIDDGTVTWQAHLDPSSGDSDYDGLDDVNVDVTTTDDDGAPGVTLSLNPASIAESGTGNISTVTARLSHPSGSATTLTVTAVSGVFTPDSGAAGTIVIPAGQTTAASDTALVTAVDNATDAPDRTETVTATVANARAAADSTTMSVTGASLTVTDDDAAPGAALALNPTSVSENAGVSTVTATLSNPSSEPSTVMVTAVPGSYTLGSDAIIVIAAGSTTASDTATVAGVDDAIHQGTAGRSVTVTGTLANGQGAGAVTGAALTLTDDETLPVVTLVPTPALISENGGVSAVTARLSGPSTAAVTVTVAAAAGTGAVASDFTLSAATTLTIAAGATTSAGTVTVRANDNAVMAGSKQVTVSGTSAGGHGAADPADTTLTITDDEAPSTALVLSPGSISENGGIATVTATLDQQVSVAVTVTVTVAAVSPAVAGDFTLSTAATLTFAANATVSTGLVTVTAVNNTTDAPDKRVTVSGAASDSSGLVNHPPPMTLTLTDDEAAPTAALALAPMWIMENGGVSTVTATLSHPSSQPSTVTVTPVSGSYTVGGGAAGTIVIAAGSTTAASDTAVVTAVDDAVVQGSAARKVTVTATLANGQGAGAVTGAALTLTDDDTLSGGPNRWNANASAGGWGLGQTSFLDVQSQQEATIDWQGGGSNFFNTAVYFCEWTAVTPGAAGTSGACHERHSRGSVQWVSLLRVRFTPTATMIANGGVAVRLTHHPAGNRVVWWVPFRPAERPALMLSSSSISENGGVATVTATLDQQVSVAVTVTVAATAVSPAVAGDFMLSTATTLTFATGATESAGLVTVTAVDNATDAPDKSVTLSGTAASGDPEVGGPPDATLTLTDDEAAPGVTLAVAPASVSENGGIATVSATLSHPSSEPSTVTVTAVSGSYTVGTDATITIAAGATAAASDTVLITAVDDDISQGSAGRSVTVAAALANGQGAGTVTGAALTLTDDETLPTATLALTSTSIAENGGVATVTATLSGESSAAVTFTVTATPVASTGAVAGDFALSTATTLTIAAGATTSAGAVTVTANDNAVDAADKQVTVSATAAGGHGVANPTNATLTLTDDEATATAALVLTPASIAESGGLATVTATLSHPTTEAVTLTVATTAVSPAVQGDFTRTGSTLTIAAGATTSTGLVTVTANDNTVASGSKRVTVAASASGGRGVAAPSGETLTLRDDEPGLNVGAVGGQATEGGGRATFTVALTTQPSEAVTVSVASRDPGEGTVSPPSLTFTTTGWETAQTVTVTGADDRVDDGTVTWNVRLAPASGDLSYNGLVPVDVPVTTTDDETLPVATLVLTPASISEAGGIATVTATLSGKSSAAVTLTVGTTAVSPAVQTDFTQTGTTLTIAAGATTSAGTVTVTAVDNSAASGSKRVTVSATAAGGNGVADPSDATLTLRDDEFSLAESAVSGQATEGGGQATFTVALRTQPTAAVTVAVSSQDTGEGLVSAGGGAPAASTTLTFAPGAWSTAQTVTVTGVDDDVDDGTVTWSVRLDPSSGDATFDGLANVDVVVTTTDDDTAGVEASPSAGLVTTEGGGEATFTVQLASEPLGAVVLDVASDDTGEGTVDTNAQAGVQSTLTFTAGDWNSAQTVTVAGVDDTLTDGDQGYTVTLAVNQAATADATYDALGTVSVSVVNRDDEVTADVNGDGAVNANDGLLMYYAYTFETVFKLENDLGRRVRGFLRTLRGAGSPAADDAGYKTMLDNAWGWRSADSAAGDVNGDGSINANDGLLMYYAYTFEAVFKLENDLGRRVRGFLRTLRGAGSPAADDAGYKAMLNAAWGLRGPSS